MKTKNNFCKAGLAALCLLFICSFASGAKADFVTEFVPTLTISEAYTDNFFQVEDPKDDDYTTIYDLELSLGLISKTGATYLIYNPSYTDYLENDPYDSWAHAVTLDSEYQLSRRLIFNFSEEYERLLNRTPINNEFHKHDTSVTTAGLTYEFGERDLVGIEYSYAFDNYETANNDEYKTHNPTLEFAYWMTPKWGVELEGEYERTEYEISTQERSTWSGEFKLLRRVSRHLDVYVAYAHTYTDLDPDEHVIYHPSVGINWAPTEDSGIDIGVGIMIQEWDSAQSADTDTEDFFLELDAYKDFAISRRLTFSITGTSGYTPTSTDAASLGFEIYYQAGGLLTYQLTRQLTADIQTSYRLTEYDAPTVNRTDNLFEAGCGLSWAPWRWLTLSLDYTFTDFQTDAAARSDYQENAGMFSISLTKPTPVRHSRTSARSELEDRLFN